MSWNILGNSAIGDFDGDGHADVFYADGQHWYISYGGASQFTYVNDSSFRVSDVLLGDFDGDGKTDVFGAVGNDWMVSYSVLGAWSYLRPKLTNTVTGLIVADFNGDPHHPHVDIARSICSPLGCGWQVSSGGKSDWTTLRISSAPLEFAAGIGHFTGKASADVLLWHGDNNLYIAAGGSGSDVRHSPQDMR